MIVQRSAVLARAALRSQLTAAPATGAAALVAAPTLAVRQNMPRCPSVRRWASSSSSSSSGSSDSLWAISSVVFFGSLFVYLTSPSVKGHAKGHTPTPHKTETFDANDETLHDLKKTEDQSDTHLESNNFLTTAAHSPNSTEAPTQKTEDAPTTSDATTLKTGVANAKDSDHISDPQNVVAAAATEKHDKEVDRKGNDE